MGEGGVAALGLDASTCWRTNKRLACKYFRRTNCDDEKIGQKCFLACNTIKRASCHSNNNNYNNKHTSFIGFAHVACVQRIPSVNLVCRATLCNARKNFKVTFKQKSNSKKCTKPSSVLGTNSSKWSSVWVSILICNYFENCANLA